MSGNPLYWYTLQKTNSVDICHMKFNSKNV